jgi:hypothetical protein
MLKKSLVLVVAAVAVVSGMSSSLSLASNFASNDTPVGVWGPKRQGELRVEGPSIKCALMSDPKSALYSKASADRVVSPRRERDTATIAR